MDHGTIIFLNGTSSSGKTTIAKLLQEIMDAHYHRTGLDHFFDMTADKFHVVFDKDNPPEPDGFLWVRTNDKEPVTEIRVGAAGYKLLSGMYRSIEALAITGNNLIVDDVLFDRKAFKFAVETLYPYGVFFIGVRCPLTVTEQREKERGDRFPGLAKSHFDLVHSHHIYDLEIDTSLLGPMECALKIKQLVKENHAPAAFKQLKDTLKNL